MPRPVDDEARIAEMFANSNLVMSAWSGEELIGISRSLTDFVWCCYLADLAVRRDFQKAGVGRKLVEMTREKVGEKSMVLLLSVRGRARILSENRNGKSRKRFYFQSPIVIY